MPRKIASGLSFERSLEQCFGFTPVPLEHGLGARRYGQGLSLATIDLKRSGGRLLGLRHRVKRSIHGKHAQVEPGHGHSAQCLRVSRTSCRSLFKALNSSVKLFSCLAVQMMASSKVPFVRLKIADVATRQRVWLGCSFGAEHVRNRKRYLILHREQVLKLALIAP